MSNKPSITGYLYFVDSSHQENTPITAKNTQSELSLFENAIKIVKTDIGETKRSIDSSNRILWEILEFYELAIQDFTMIDTINDSILKTHLTAESAINLYFDNYIASLNTKDAYFKSRTNDFIDLKHRLIHALKNHKRPITSLNRSFTRPTILVFESVFPYELSQMKFSNIVGVISTVGSLHSHVAIILSSLKIPYLIIPMVKTIVHSNDLVHVDLTTSVITLTDTIPQVIEDVMEINDDLSGLVEKKFSLHPAINLENEIPDEIPSDWSSIGLYRTEFMFMNKNYLPDEIEQYLDYRKICQKVKNIRVHFRLLDVEIDKPLPSIEEKIYGIDLLLQHHQLLKTQLTALLSVSKDYPIGITVPMIENQEQINLIKESMDAIKNTAEFQSVQLNYRFGIMVERKSALKNFSRLMGFDYNLIGTNDLSSEYAAIDRLNLSMSKNNYLDKELQSDIKHLLDNANSRDILTILCGDGANIQDVLFHYYRLGIRHFSPSPKNIRLYHRLTSQ